jgi:hypothetical protein
MSEKRLIDYAKLEEYRGTLNQYVDTIWNSLEPASEFIQSELDKKEEKVFNDIGSDVCGNKDMFEEVMRLGNNIKSEYWIGVYHVLKIFKQKYIKGESNGKDS